MTGYSLYLVTMLLGSRVPATIAPPVVQPAHIFAMQAQQFTSHEQRLVDLINKERRNRDLPELKVNPMLVRIAREHSKEMCDMDYFDHVSPNPELRTPKARYLKGLGHTPSWACIAENLFYSSVVDANLAHKCLMESDPHKQNILSDQFSEVGVGVYESPDGKFWVTQMFITQID